MTDKARRLDGMIENGLEFVSALKDDVARGGDTGSLNELSMALTTLVNSVREKMQEETRFDMRRLIRALEADEAISSSDRELVRIWMVGDADAYVRMENDLKNWVSELNRLLAEISNSGGKAQSPQEWMDLHGKIRDALRTAGDIQYYRQQEERVRRFETSASGEWTREDKRVLARLLREKLTSDDL